MIPTDLRCVLFDLDGTLIDTAPDLGHAANLVRADAGLPPLDLALYRPVASAGARGLLRVGMALTPEHPNFDAWRNAFLEYYRHNMTRASRPFAGVDALLQEIEQRGLRWGVVTNKPSWLTRPLMHKLGLTGRAACIVSADDAPRAKPAPDTLLLACAHSNVSPSQCVYVGDDMRDITAGRAAAMTTIGVEWGYFGDNPDIRTWGADHVVATPADLATLLFR